MESKEHTCTLCAYRSTTSKGLAIHHSKKHPDPSRMCCPPCHGEERDTLLLRTLNNFIESLPQNWGSNPRRSPAMGHEATVHSLAKESFRGGAPCDHPVSTTAAHTPTCAQGDRRHSDREDCRRFMSESFRHPSSPTDSLGLGSTLSMTPSTTPSSGIPENQNPFDFPRSPEVYMEGPCSSGAFPGASRLSTVASSREQSCSHRQETFLLKPQSHYRKVRRVTQSNEKPRRPSGGCSQETFSSNLICGPGSLCSRSGGGTLAKLWPTCLSGLQSEQGPPAARAQPEQAIQICKVFIDALGDCEILDYNPSSEWPIILRCSLCTRPVTGISDMEQHIRLHLLQNGHVCSSCVVPAEVPASVSRQEYHEGDLTVDPTTVSTDVPPAEVPLAETSSPKRAQAKSL